MQGHRSSSGRTGDHWFSSSSKTLVIPNSWASTWMSKANIEAMRIHQNW